MSIVTRERVKAGADSAVEHVEYIGATVAAVGVLLFWQGIGPTGVSTGLLVAGAVVYALFSEGDGEDDQ